MMKISFESEDDECTALGVLAARVPLRTFSTGITIVPDGALKLLDERQIKYTNEGRASYAETIATGRDSAPAPVQRR